MKSLYSLLFFLFTIPNVTSQEKITIVFSDSTEIKGYGSIRADDRIFYRKDKNAQKEIYTYKTPRKVRKLTIHNQDSDKIYEYKIIENSGKSADIKLLEITKTGKINLYKETYTGMTNPAMAGGMSMPYSTSTYYISKNNEIFGVNLRQGNVYSKRFRRIAKKYFSDCPDLMNKIKARDFFKRYGIESVVDYYNETCE